MPISDVLKHARKLKKIPRTGWVRSGIENPESVAEHSYEVALIVSVISDQLGLDHSKLVRAALIHDLAESVTGDIPFKSSKQAAAEKATLSKIVGSVPEVKEKYLAPLTEQEQAVLDFADNLSMLRQAEEYGVEEIRKTASATIEKITKAFPELSSFLQKS